MPIPQTYVIVTSSLILTTTMLSGPKIHVDEVLRVLMAFGLLLLYILLNMTNICCLLPNRIRSVRGIIRQRKIARKLYGVGRITIKAQAEDYALIKFQGLLSLKNYFYVLIGLTVLIRLFFFLIPQFNKERLFEPYFAGGSIFAAYVIITVPLVYITAIPALIFYIKHFKMKSKLKNFKQQEARLQKQTVFDCLTRKRKAPAASK